MYLHYKTANNIQKMRLQNYINFHSIFFFLKMCANIYFISKQIKQDNLYLILPVRIIL